MTVVEEHKKQKVIIAAGVASYSMATLGLAVQMAASTKMRLQGLFVEDEDLIQVTGLPITREISLTTAHERPTDVVQMQRALRSVATQFEQSLKREARASKIGCSFDYVRGRLGDIGLKSDAHTTYTILDRTGLRRPQRKPARVPARILVIANESPHQMRALKIVLDQYSHEKIELVVVGLSRESGFLAELEQLSTDRKGEISLQPWSPDQLAGLLARHGSEFNCAIISRHQMPLELSQILRALVCPVVLVA